MTTAQVSRLQGLLAASPASSYNELAAMEAETMPPPRALHTPGPDDFIVDPNSPYLESGPNSAAQTPTAANRDSRRSGGRFATLVKRVVSMNKQKHAAQGHLPTIAPTRDMRASIRSTRPPNIHSSPATSSDTAYSPHEVDDNYDGTTAVDHQMLPIASVHGSPVYVEPQPGPDYAKMETPSTSTGSITSFSSYITRVQKFFHDINELPWVAERVTVDYVPGQSRRRHAPSRSLHRPTSWYGSRPGLGNQIYIEPSSKSSSSSSPISPSFVIPVAPVPSASFSAAVPPPTYPRPMQTTSSSRWKPIYPNGYVPPDEAASMAARYPGVSFHNTSHAPASASPSVSSAAEQV